MSTTRTITITYPDGTEYAYKSGAKAIKRFAVVGRDTEAKAAATRDQSIASYERFRLEAPAWSDEDCDKAIARAHENYEADQAWGTWSQNGSRALAEAEAAKAREVRSEVVVVEIDDPAAK